MNERTLVICDGEINYANALAENIMEREELYIKVFTFADVEKAQEFARGKMVHIWVMDEALTRTETVAAEVRFVLVHGGHSELGSEEHPIYKYQCASQIIQEIFEVYSEMTDETFLKE